MPGKSAIRKAIRHRSHYRQTNELVADAPLAVQIRQGSPAIRVRSATSEVGSHTAEVVTLQPPTIADRLVYLRICFCWCNRKELRVSALTGAQPCQAVKNHYQNRAEPGEV